MRKVKLLLAAALSLMAWTGTMAQTQHNAENYEAAKTAITEGTYRIKTTVSGTDYYVTTSGTLTSNLAGAGYFDISQTSGGNFGTGFRINGASGRFTNPPLSNSLANLKPGNFATSSNDRADWERQILYKNGDGKYAIRSCNCADGTSSWNDAARTHWTTYLVGDVVTPCYSYTAEYIWDFEGPLTAVNVTYKLVEADGSTEVSTTTVKQEANSAVISPLPGTGINYNGFFHEKFYYDYTVSGTIGDTDCTITITRTEKAGVVKALTDLSNNKAYNIGCDRGAMIAYDGKMVNTALNDATVNAQPYGKFALLNYEGNYYIFSIDENKFVKNDASVALDLTTVGFSTADAMVMTPQTAPYFLWHFNATDKYLNTNGNTPLGYVINSYSTPDPGNLYYMIAVDDFDPTAALAELEAYFHPSYFVTYVVKDELGNTIFTSEPQPTKLGAKITTLLDEFKRPYYTYNDVDVTISQEQTTVEFTATWNGPFKLSADFANAQWQNMAMRGTWYVTSAIKDGDGAYKTQNANTMGLVEDSYQWAFLGNGYDGFKVINKAEGDGKSFGYGDVASLNSGSIPTIMDDSEGNHLWKIVASTNTTVPANSFCLGVPGTDLYINQYGGAGGSLKFWNTTGNIGDAGSAFTIFDVPSNFASYLVDEGIAAEYDAAYAATGYFALTDAAKATLGWDPAYKTDCPFETYKSLKENLAAAKADLSNFVLPETGFYTLKNKNYGTYLGIDPSDANMYGNYAAANLPKHIVKLTKNADNTYTIGLMGKFAPATVAQSAQVTATAEAGTYTVVIPAIGYAAFQADTENNMSVLHCAGGGSIVGWETAAAASQWQVADAESIQLTIGETGYATAYLPFPATPAGVYTPEIPKALGTWTFDDPTDLTAGTGTATLQATTHAKNNVTATDPATAGITVVEGPEADNGAVNIPVGSSLLMAANNGAANIGTYSIMYDVCVEDGSTYVPLLQNSLTDGKDGSLFINQNKVGLGGGIGYHGSIENNKWYRIVFTVNTTEAALYVDGNQLTTYAVSTTNTNAPYLKHWILTTGALFFADEDGEEKAIKTAELRFWDVALTAGQVEMLGGVGHVPSPKASDLKVYTASLETNERGNFFLGMNELEGTIPEATPVILKATPDTYVFNIGEGEEVVPEGALKLNETEVDASNALVKGYAAAQEENVLKGTFEPINAVGLYVLAKPASEPIGFYLAETGTIAAGKAYLELAPSVDVKALYFDFGGEATGMSEELRMKNEESKTEEIYNLAGQRLNKAQKGINIVNGKKILF